MPQTLTNIPFQLTPDQAKALDGRQSVGGFSYFSTFNELFSHEVYGTLLYKGMRITDIANSRVHKISGGSFTDGWETEYFDNKRIHLGSGAPALNLGFDDDVYINSATGGIYKKGVSLEGEWGDPIITFLTSAGIPTYSFNGSAGQIEVTENPAKTFTFSLPQVVTMPGSLNVPSKEFRVGNHLSDPSELCFYVDTPNVHTYVVKEFSVCSDAALSSPVFSVVPAGSVLINDYNFSIYDGLTEQLSFRVSTGVLSVTADVVAEGYLRTTGGIFVNATRFTVDSAGGTTIKNNTLTLTNSDNDWRIELDGATGLIKSNGNISISEGVSATGEMFGVVANTGNVTAAGLLTVKTGATIYEDFQCIKETETPGQVNFSVAKETGDITTFGSIKVGKFARAGHKSVEPSDTYYLDLSDGNTFFIKPTVSPFEIRLQDTCDTSEKLNNNFKAGSFIITVKNEIEAPLTVTFINTLFDGVNQPITIADGEALTYNGVVNGLDASDCKLYGVIAPASQNLMA